MPAIQSGTDIPEDEFPLNFTLPDRTPFNPTVGQFRQMPGALQAQLAPYVNEGRLQYHHDTLIMAAGTAQTVGQKLDTFKTGIGELGTVWNTAATFTKTDFHTTAGVDGILPFGVAGIIVGIELLYIPYPAKAATVGSSSTIGQVTDSADHASQPTGYNALALLRAMLFQNRWEWHWTENSASEVGQYWQLPARFALSGFAGAATATLAQNAQFNSTPRGLSKTKVIRNNEKAYFVRNIAQSALAQPVDFVAQMIFTTIEVGTARND